MASYYIETLFNVFNYKHDYNYKHQSQQTPSALTNLSTTMGFFTIRKSDAFLSDYLTDLKLHRTK